MNNLTVVILTKNSEKTLEKALLSVVDISGEIIIVDDFSTDKTLKIAKKFKTKIYKKKLNDFSDQRNFALKKSKSAWILFLDSDEFLSKSLAKEIETKIKNNKINGYFIKRIDIFLGKEIMYGEAGHTKLLRLGKNNFGKWERTVHETWKIQERTETLKNFLYHNSHENLESFLNSINKFSSLHALANKKEGKKSNIAKIIVWPIAKFVYSYIYCSGFLDGIHGLIYAVMMSIHSFLSWSKLWVIQNKK